MKLLFDFFPILVFFVAYKLCGIYYATAMAIIASLTLVIYSRIKNQCFDKTHVISLVIITILGGATLFFHNPWFIKWKPTGIYWISALVFLGSAFMSKKPLIQTMMENNIRLPSAIWQRLNMIWVVFFIVMGLINIYVAYNFTTDVWVNFKLIGGIGLTMLFVLIQAVFLAKHADVKNTEEIQ